MKSDAVHCCRLPYPEEDALKQTINTGIFILMRRRWYGFCMISEHHPRTWLYFNSTEARKKEGLKHVVYNINIIHPLSMFALYWEITIFFVYLYCFILQAVSSVYLFRRAADVFIVMTTLGDFLLIADIIKTFFTGIYDKELNRTIFKTWKIAKRYLKFYFWVDLLSIMRVFSIPLVLFSLDVYKVDMIITITRFLGLLKIFRISRLLDSFDLFRQLHNYSTYRFKMVTVVIFYIIILSWLFALGLLIENLLVTYFYEDVPTVSNMFLSMTMLLELISYGFRPVNETHHFILIVIFISLGFTLELFLYAQLMQVVHKFKNARNKNENLFQQFQEYSKYKMLPVELRTKIFHFFEFRYQNKIFNERKIESTLSRTLKSEVQLHVTEAHIRKVEMFSGIPKKLLIKLVSKLRTEIYLPEDEIVCAGTPGTCMYFIHFGTVAVYTPSGKELCHLQDGAHFGEIALVFNEKRVASVIAATPCELFKLKKSDFFEVMKPFPQLMETITETARLRMIHTRKEF